MQAETMQESNEAADQAYHAACCAGRLVDIIAIDVDGLHGVPHVVDTTGVGATI